MSPKMKDASLMVEKWKIPSFEPFVQISLSALSFTHGAIRTHPASCSWVCCEGAWCYKIQLSINTSHELVLGAILCPINLLPFHGGKEGLGYSIVMRTAGLRERLDDLVHAKQFPECVRCILWAMVAVKHQLLGLVSILICLTKGGTDQVGAIL